MGEEQYLLRTVVKAFKDKETKKSYFFDINFFLEVSKGLNASEIANKVTLICLDENQSEEAIKKRIQRALYYAYGLENGTVSIDTIKELGEALTGNKMSFLLVPYVDEHVVRMGNDILRIENSIRIGNDMFLDINAKEEHSNIYSQLNNVLYVLEESDFYNYIPGSKEDGELYFKKVLDNIQKNVDKTYIDNPIIRKKLYKLIGEVAFITSSFSLPGVTENWYELNPNINYFDCVYDIIENNPDLYESIKKGSINSSKVKFRLYPTTNDVILRNRYFEEKRKLSPNITKAKLYQSELIEVLFLRYNQCVKE